LIGRAVLVREGLAAWVRMSRPPPSAVPPLPAAVPVEASGIPTAGIADAIATLILSLPMEKSHA
jgi:hypothetical protein